MPKAWSAKDERQYEHVKKSARSRGGRAAKRAKEIAARTVNKQRSQEGRTSQSKGASKGNSHGKGRRTGASSPLTERSRQELYGMARKLDIPNRSKMNKRELVRAVRSHQ